MLACTKDFEEFNTDVKRPAQVTGEALFTNAQKSLADQVSTPNVNLNIFNLFAQYWNETTYTDETNYDIVNRTIADNTFQEFYRDVLTDLKEAARLITDQTTSELNTAEDVNNKLLIIELLTVYTYKNLVDIFGNIPYTEALDINNLLPAYDDAAEIYSSLIERTNNAINGLVVTGNEGFGSADLIYGGDIESWVKFGNALKIKLGITIADVNEALARSTIESAVGGAFTSSADDALFPYQGSTPNTNQIYAELILTGRHDFVPANTMVDIMNELEDPRRAVYFTLIDTSTVPEVEKLAYLGGTYGENSPFTQYSHVSDLVQDPAFEGIILTYDEILFYLADAAARGFDVGGTDEDLYNQAVTASFEFWGLSADSAAAYLENPDVAWATSAGDFRQKIGTQSWIAFYTRGLEGYTQWRRLDYPILNMPPTISDYNQIPKRFTYPIGEQTLNPDNYKAASDAIGTDRMTTPLFWDVAQPVP
jgi:hypothetical protein